MEIEARFAREAVEIEARLAGEGVMSGVTCVWKLQVDAIHSKVRTPAWPLPVMK